MAAITVALAVWLKLLLDKQIGGQTPFLLMFTPVVISAWVGGLGPGLVATVLAGGAAVFLFLGAANPPEVMTSEWLRLGVFAVEGVVISALCHLRQTSERSLKRQREYFRVTLGSIGDAVIATDTSGTITFMNSVAERLTGWTEDEGVGRLLESVFRIVDDESGEPLRSPVAAILAAGKAVSLSNNAAILDKDGGRVPIEHSGGPIRAIDGSLIGTVLVFRDVTHKKAADRRTREADARRAAILETALDAIITMDDTGNVVDFNPAAETTFGYKKEEAVGRELCALIIPPSLRDAHRRGLKHFLETGTGPMLGKRLEMDAVRADGSEFPAELTVNASSVGGKALFTGTVRNITERRRVEKAAQDELAERRKAEEALKRNAAELARSNADLERFAYLASHDLQEPLRTVASYTQLIAKRYAGKLDADADDFIGYTLNGVNRMQALIQDLLVYSRVGTAANNSDGAEAETALTEALSNLGEAISTSGAKVTHEPLPRVGEAHAQLVQLLQNLTGNAIKFRSQDPPTVHISAAEEGGCWHFKVQDNGIGFAPEYQEQIFEVFQRLHSETQYPGTGVGLAICKRIVEAWGGRIWVDSKPGQGSDFHFTIPKR